MPTEQSADCRQRTIGKVKNLAGTVFINRTFASTECKEYYCLPATQRSAGCLLTCNEVDSANANAWQSGRVQKDGQESSVSLTFCFVVGASACMIICTRSSVDSGASGARRRERFPCKRHVVARKLPHATISTHTVCGLPHATPSRRSRKLMVPASGWLFIHHAAMPLVRSLPVQSKAAP